ncbi:MAG: hypothetical protein E7359_02120 [Clostridiales bacterium]|nr:hypothetical protein [Clostridiales bacterium]
MKELLKYQELDIELKKIEKKVNGSEFFKNVNKSKEIAKKSQIRMIEINEEAKKIIEDINKIAGVKNKGLDLVQKYVNTNVDNMQEKDVLEIANKIKPIRKNLEELISRLNILENKMARLLEEFDNMKKQIINSKKVYDENKGKLDSLKEEVEPEIEKAKQKLQNQEKNVNPDLILKYRNLKREGVFPVLVSLNEGKSCGYCRVEQSMHKLEKLKLTGFTECEQCHRIIISD